ncbi:hypothetical protein DFH09DRAFT_1193190 [Mycena vulgaris]|nr:hypothetical protein DFH09DRAFT_1193190 [Mycena vulgaris]
MQGRGGRTPAYAAACFLSRTSWAHLRGGEADRIEGEVCNKARQCQCAHGDQKITHRMVQGAPSSSSTVARHREWGLQQERKSVRARARREEKGRTHRLMSSTAHLVRRRGRGLQQAEKASTIEGRERGARAVHVESWGGRRGRRVEWGLENEASAWMAGLGGR